MNLKSYLIYMNNTRHYLAGLIGGIVGGIVLGILLTAINVMPLVSLTFRSLSMTVAWTVLLVVSAIIGLLFAWWFGFRANDYSSGIGYGILHAIIWWAVLWLVIIPIAVGGYLYTAGQGVLTLIGYLVFGLVLGIIHEAIDQPHIKYHQQHA